MDDKIIDFFEFLEKKGSLKDTSIILHSDHGMNMPGFYTVVDAPDFHMEKSLPTLFLITPQDVAQKYKKELVAKENMFLNPYDLHNTFLHMVDAPESAFNKLGGSLFKSIDDKKRTCDLFRIRDPFCNCLEEDENDWYA